MNILILTDFSYNAQKAAKYAIKLFGTDENNYTLLNSVLLPHAGAVFMDTLKDDLKSMSEKKMGLITQMLLDEFPTVKIKEVIETGPLITVVDRELRANDYQTVVIGANGSAGVYEKLIGTSALEIINHSTIPVLVVPVVNAATELNAIVVGVENTSERLSNGLMKWLANFLEEKKNVSLLHIHNSREAEVNLDEMKNAITEQVPNSECTVHTKPANGARVESLILEFAEEVDANLIVTKPFNHSFIRRLFNRSVSEELLDRSHIPVLLIK